MKKKRLLIIAPIIIIVIISAGLLYKIILRNIYPQKYEEYVEKYSEKYDIEKEWIYAIIKTESNFDINSISSSGAIGLMQLMEETAVEESNEARNRKN